MITYKAKDLLT